MACLPCSEDVGTAFADVKRAELDNDSASSLVEVLGTTSAVAHYGNLERGLAHRRLRCGRELDALDAKYCHEDGGA